MPSTPSSAEKQPKNSATETLAGRYRHLFVLPSTSILVLYSAVASAVLAFVSRGPSGTVLFLLVFIVFLLAAAAISSTLRLADRTTIADFRRTCAALLVGDVLWGVLVACGAISVLLTGFSIAITNAFVFGAFATAGFEFLILDSVFTDRTLLAVTLSGVQPIASLIALRGPEISSTRIDPIPWLFGALAFVTIASFTQILKRRKTTTGYSVLNLFRGFMKAWAAEDAADLESIISDHSKETQVTTRVFRFQTQTGSLFLVLPGVHPGPFHPIGSYDLPGVITRAFRGQGTVLTLHRPGGHERNLATRQETERYANEIRELALAITPSFAGIDMKGPIHTDVGTAKVSAIAFSNEVILTVSFAPLGSDDLNAAVETELWARGQNKGLDVSVVDAHNSLVDVQESLDCSDTGWTRLFGQIKMAEASDFKIGCASSAELGFNPHGDMTENGITLIMFGSKHRKSVLVLADANNSVPQLKGEVAKALNSQGYDLIEFCTSDSHNLAAKGMTVSRGYRALGETTSIEVLTRLVSDLARLAETRLLECNYGSGLSTSTVRVFGTEALEEFASITQSTSNLAKTYLKGATVLVLALLVLSLVF